MSHVTHHIPVSSSPSSIARPAHAPVTPVTMKAPASMEMRHTQTNRKEEWGMGAGAYPLLLRWTDCLRWAEQGNQQIRPQLCEDRGGATASANPDANPPPNRHCDIALNGELRESRDAQTPLLLFPVHLQTLFLLLWSPFDNPRTARGKHRSFLSANPNTNTSTCWQPGCTNNLHHGLGRRRKISGRTCGAVDILSGPPITVGWKGTVEKRLHSYTCSVSLIST